MNERLTELMWTHQGSEVVDSQGVAVFSTFLILVVLIYEFHVFLKHNASAYISTGRSTVSVRRHPHSSTTKHKTYKTTKLI